MFVSRIILLGLTALSTLSYEPAESTNITVYSKCRVCSYIAYRSELRDVLLFAKASYIKCRNVGVDTQILKDMHSNYMSHFT
jgi:hypothetical protein